MSNLTSLFNDTGDFLRNFSAPALVVSVRDSPRFGHTTDITALMGTSEESSDYVKGLLAAAFLTIICFFVAFMSLPILMCLGRRRVGFLSGAPLTGRSNPASSTSNGGDEHVTDKEDGDVPLKPEGSTGLEEMKDNEELNNNIDSLDGLHRSEVTVRNGPKCRNCCLDPSHIWVRGTFVLSGIIFILFSILLVTQGVLNLQDTVDSVNSLATQIDTLALDAEDILRSGLLGLQTQATNVRDLIVTNLDGDNFCPADPTLQNSTVFADIREKANNASEVLSQLNNFLGNEVERLSDSINDAAKGAREVQSATEDVNIAGGKLAIILIPYTVVPFMLILAAVLAHFDKDFPMLNRANRWFFMPFFLILVIIAAGTASGMIAAASANSDFCLPGGQKNDDYPGTSPDTTIWRVLDRKRHTADLERKIADFYIDQCQNKPDPFLFLRSYVPQVMDSRAMLDDFSQSIQSNTTLSQLSAYCNRDYDDLDQLIVEMRGFLDVIFDSLRRTLELISCGRIVPIYHSAFYDSSCAYSASAVVWVFASSLIMGTFGILMLLFRAACKPTLHEDALIDTDQNEHVVYDEGLKELGEGDVVDDVIVDDAEVEKANDKFSPSAHNDDGENANEIFGEDAGLISKKVDGSATA